MWLIGSQQAGGWTWVPQTYTTQLRRELGLGYPIATVARCRWTDRIHQNRGHLSFPLPQGEASVLRFESLALGESLEWCGQHAPRQGVLGAGEDANMHDVRWFARRHRPPVLTKSQISLSWNCLQARRLGQQCALEGNWVLPVNEAPVPWPFGTAAST